MAYKVITAPASEPLTSGDVKAWLKISTSADDAVITMLIKAAREYVEKYLGIALLEQTVEEYFDRFPPRRFIRLSVGNVSSVTHVKYIDDNGTEVPLPDTVYEVDKHSQHARVYLKADEDWETTDSELNNVKVTYVAGYASASAIPSQVILAMYKFIADNYHLRTDQTKRFTTAVDIMLDQIRQTIFWEYV